MPPVTSNFTCPDCGKQYKAKETLTRHRKNHETSAQYTCSTCSNTFKRKDLLTRHIATHESKERGVLRARRANNSACERCSLRKLRCDGSTTCSGCARASEPCIHRADQGDTGILTENQGASETGISFPSDGSEYGQAAIAPAEPALAFMPQMEFDSNWATAYDAGEQYNPNAFELSGWPWLHEAMYMQNENIWPSAAHAGYFGNEYSGNISLSLTTGQASSRHNGGLQVVRNAEHAAHADINTPIPELATAFAQSQTGNLSLPVDQYDQHTDNTNRSGDEQDPTHLQNGISNFSRPGTPEPIAKREAVIHEIVSYSLKHAEDPAFGIWNRQQTSSKISQTFDLSRLGVAPDGVLDHFVGLYFENFHMLWLLFHQKTLQAVYRDAPYLYLTLSVIGSAFAGQDACLYHTILLNALRKTLTRACFSDTMPDHQLESLCGSLQLVRISFMYFGHARALTAIQMIGGALIYLARKLDLFGSAALSGHLPCEINGRVGSPRWIRSETRKHLAAGLLLLESDVSLLFGTRPLVSAEEFGVSLPCSLGIWTSESPSPPIPAGEDVERPLFSQLVRIALDLDEPFPDLDSWTMKLIMYGVQEHVWRYSWEQGFMYRFGQNAGENPENRTNHKLSDHSRRPMKDYWTGRERLIRALNRCNETLSANTVLRHAQSQRSNLLAGRVLFHLSFMKLMAPLSFIHQIFLDTSQHNPNGPATRTVKAWAHTEEASNAAHHALKVRALLKIELDRENRKRAKFMVLSQLGMFHAAAILWAIAGARNASELRVLDPLTNEEIQLNQASNSVLMHEYAEVLHNLGPEWYSMSSFLATVNDMASVKFPSQVNQ